MLIALLPSAVTAITSSRTIENLAYLDRRQAGTLYQRKREWPVRAIAIHAVQPKYNE